MDSDVAEVLLFGVVVLVTVLFLQLVTGRQIGELPFPVIAIVAGGAVLVFEVWLKPQFLHKPAGSARKAKVEAIVDKTLAERPSIAKLKKENPVVYRTLRETIVEGLRNRQTTDQILDTFMSKDVFWSAVKEHDPEIYRQARTAILVAVGKGQSEEQLVLLRDKYITDLINKYIPTASDEAVLAFMQVVITIVQKVSEEDPEAAFDYLWQQHERNIDSYITKNTEEAMNAVVVLIIETGKTKPQALPDITVVESKATQLADELRKTHGNDVEMLSDQKAASANKKRACELMLEFFNKMMALPPKDASMLIRHMLASK